MYVSYNFIVKIEITFNKFTDYFHNNTIVSSLSIEILFRC